MQITRLPSPLEYMSPACIDRFEAVLRRAREQIKVNSVQFPARPPKKRSAATASPKTRLVMQHH